MGFAKCPICLKQNYMAVREEQEQKQRANASQNRSSKRVGRRPRTGSVAQSDAAANDNEAASQRMSTNLDSTMRQSQQTFDGDMSFMNDSMDRSGMANRTSAGLDTIMNRTSVGLDTTMSGNRMSSLLDADMSTNRPNSTMLDGSMSTMRPNSTKLDGSMSVNDTTMMQAEEPNVLSLETIR